MIGQKVTEKLVSQMWRYHLHDTMYSDRGDTINVLFPGRLSNGCSCDFQDAVIDFDGMTLIGNIEIHVRSSQWYAHGHHHDSRYNGIILHVAYWNDTGIPITLENGTTIPTVCLHDYLDIKINYSYSNLNLKNNLYSCTALEKYKKHDNIIDAIYLAGQKRFEEKTGMFLNHLSVKEPGQLLYSYIARALGYDKNSIPMMKVAELLPINIIEQNPDLGSEFVRALLLGTAGFLPSQRTYVKENSAVDLEELLIEHIWFTNKNKQMMDFSEWSFLRVRPFNSPIRRVVGLSYLVEIFRHTGFLSGVVAEVRRSCNNSDPKDLVKKIMIPGIGYWANHFDFGKSSSCDSAIIGYSKAAEITTNVLLPFVYTWAKLNSELKLQKQSKDLYVHQSALPDNQITRFMKQQLLIPVKYNLTAVIQQGLIFIFTHFCRSRNCSECLISVTKD